MIGLRSLPLVHQAVGDGRRRHERGGGVSARTGGIVGAGESHLSLWHHGRRGDMAWQFRHLASLFIFIVILVLFPGALPRFHCASNGAGSSPSLHEGGLSRRLHVLNGIRSKGRGARRCSQRGGDVRNEPGRDRKGDHLGLFHRRFSLLGVILPIIIGSSAALVATPFLRRASTSASWAARLLSGRFVRVGTRVGVGDVALGGRPSGLADIVVRPATDLGGPVSRRGLDWRVILNCLAVVELDSAQLMAGARVGHAVRRGGGRLKLAIFGGGGRCCLAGRGRRRASRAGTRGGAGSWCEGLVRWLEVDGCLSTPLGHRGRRSEGLGSHGLVERRRRAHPPTKRRSHGGTSEGRRLKGARHRLL